MFSHSPAFRPEREGDAASYTAIPISITPVKIQALRMFQAGIS
jgi:hypothetical protein